MRFLRAYLVVVFFLYAILIVHFIGRTPIWSPLDEIGHYDYIDQLSSGRIPLPTEPISDYTFAITRDHFDWIMPGAYVGTKDTMGQAGISYEGQQPPTYYLMLAAPNLLLKALNVDPARQIFSLRLISALFQVLGATAGGLVVSRLQKVLRFSDFWIWFIPVVLLIPGWSWRSSLGNGALSLLFVNLALFFLLGSLLGESDRRNGTLAVLFGSLAFLTKYTNILSLAFVVGMLAVRALLRARNQQRPFSARQVLAAVWPLSLIVLYLGFNISRFGWSDPLGSRTVEMLFGDIPITVWGSRFFIQFFESTYEIPFLPARLPLLQVLAIGAAATGARALWFFLRKAFPAALAWVATGGLALVVPIFAWLMTKIAPTVDWSFFRHFSGYLLPIVLVTVGGVMRAGIAEKVVIGLFSLALLVPLISYLPALLA